MFEQSKATKKTIAVLIDYRTQLSTLTPQIEAAKAGTGDIDDLALRVGTMEAKRSVIANRIELTRDELVKTLVDDITAAHEDAVKVAAKADKTYRSELATWRETCRQKLPPISASAFTSSPNAAPESVRDLCKLATKTRDAAAELERTRLLIDNAYRAQVMGEAIRMDGATRTLTRDQLVGNADSILATIAG